MLSWVKYKVQIWGLDRAQARTRKAFDKERRQKAPLSSADAYKINDQEHFETRMIDDERSETKTYRLLDQAQHYDLPTPAWDDEEAWDKSSNMGVKFLKPKAFADLRSAVRKEQNELWQYWELRLKVVSAILVGLTGVMGTLIGLIATWRN